MSDTPQSSRPTVPQIIRWVAPVVLAGGVLAAALTIGSAGADTPASPPPATAAEDTTTAPTDPTEPTDPSEPTEPTAPVEPGSTTLETTIIETAPPAAAPPPAGADTDSPADGVTPGGWFVLGEAAPAVPEPGSFVLP